MSTIEITHTHNISQTSINYPFKFRIYRCFAIERFNAILWHEIIKKEISRIQVHTHTHNISPSICKMRTGIDFEVVICSLPGKHFSLQLYAESSINAIIYWAETTHPYLRIPDDGLVPTTHLGNGHQWSGVGRQIWVIRQVGPLSPGSSRLSKRVSCHRG